MQGIGDDAGIRVGGRHAVSVFGVRRRDRRRFSHHVVSRRRRRADRCRHRGVADLATTELEQITDVILTHAHSDHTACLPLLIDATISKRAEPLVVRGTRENLDALSRHVFNNQIWPDFTRIPTPERPFLRYVPLTPGEPLALGERRSSRQRTGEPGLQRRYRPVRFAVARGQPDREPRARNRRNLVRRRAAVDRRGLGAPLPSSAGRGAAEARAAGRDHAHAHEARCAGDDHA